jgi:hypothetical protein
MEELVDKKEMHSIAVTLSLQPHHAETHRSSLQNPKQHSATMWVDEIGCVVYEGKSLKDSLLLLNLSLFKNHKFLHKTEPDSFTRLLLASFQKQDSKAFGVLLPTACL